LQIDREKKFYNVTLKKTQRESLFDVFNNDSVERFNCMLKNDMWKLFTLNKNDKWIDSLEHLISDYNARKHRIIGIWPIDITYIPRTPTSPARKKIFNFNNAALFCWICLVAERMQLNAGHWLHKGLISISFNTKPFQLLKFDSAINVDISSKSIAHAYGYFTRSSRESNITQKEQLKKFYYTIYFIGTVPGNQLKHRYNIIKSMFLIVIAIRDKRRHYKYRKNDELHLHVHILTIHETWFWNAILQKWVQIISAYPSWGKCIHMVMFLSRDAYRITLQWIKLYIMRIMNHKFLLQPKIIFTVRPFLFMKYILSLSYFSA